MADLEKIERIIDKHPLNGRYGFTREDVIAQLQMQAGLTSAEAFGSQSRGANKMMIKQETVIYLALLAEAALAPAPSPPLPDSTLREQVAALVDPNAFAKHPVHPFSPYQIDGQRGALKVADRILPLFAVVSAEAEKRGAAKGWDESYEATLRFRPLTSKQKPVNPYTVTPKENTDD